MELNPLRFSVVLRRMFVTAVWCSDRGTCQCTNCTDNLIPTCQHVTDLHNTRGLKLGYTGSEDSFKMSVLYVVQNCET